MSEKRSFIQKMAVLFSLLAMGVACEKIEKLLTFQISNETSCTIPGATTVNPVFTNIVPTPPVTTQSSQTFQKQGTSADKVKNVTLERLRLAIASPDNADFRFVESIKIYIQSDGLPKVLLASKTHIPTNAGKSIDLDASGEKLDAYIKADSYTLSNEVVTRSAPWPEMGLKIYTTFQVTADPL